MPHTRYQVSLASVQERQPGSSEEGRHWWASILSSEDHSSPAAASPAHPSTVSAPQLLPASALRQHPSCAKPHSKSAKPELEGSLWPCAVSLERQTQQMDMVGGQQSTGLCNGASHLASLALNFPLCKHIRGAHQPLNTLPPQTGWKERTIANDQQIWDRIEATHRGQVFVFLKEIK